MPLDEFKTQVLLLHSDQDTLDSLGSQFSDRYTVHYATSGSQALNALAEVPINVIVSAQDLPGMSGLEALREAKKRSPDTVGILLAGDEGEEVEALVGDKEVFQVVHGNIDAGSLLELVESVTREVRLSALSESANDTAAEADGAEHIVMETSDNGESVISQSSVRLRALNPKSFATATPVDILVLTTDGDFLETIQSSTGSRHKVRAAETLAEASEIIRSHPVGVAVIDAAIVRGTVEQLTQYMRREATRLVPVVAGRRDDGEMLMDLINRGKVYRFLLKPVSAGRARLAVEASVKHHIDAPDSAFTSETHDQADTPAAEQAATSGETAPTTAPAPTADAGNPADAATDATTVTPEPSGDGGSVEADLLKETGSSRLSAMVDAATSGSEERNAKSKMLAVAAMVAVVVVGTLLWFGLSPDGEPTIAKVPETTPTSTATDVEVSTPAIDESVNEALQLAESALLESQLQVAAAALQQVADADPDNARLPFLTAQLSQAQLRNNLTEARTAIRDGRFEDAADALSAALALNVVDSSEIDALTTELDNARSNQQTDDVLALANDRLESGDLLTPKNSSARYYYDLVLTNDPDNTAARQGLDIIVSRLVLQARGDIDEGRFDAAQELLYEARSIDSTNAEMIATADALQLARKAAARQAAARRAAAEKAAAEKAAAEQAAAEQAAAEQAAAEEALAEPASQSGAIAPAEAQSGAAGFGSVQSAGSTAPAEATPSPELAAAPPPTDATPTGISSLERTRYVAPKYPRSAVRRNQSGWVDVSFTVATDGSVKDISIRDSEPGDLFVGAATRAVEQWEFKPVVENGVVIEQPAAVRMMFSLD